MGNVRPPDSAPNGAGTHTGSTDTDFGLFNRGMWAEPEAEARHIGPCPETPTPSPPPSDPSPPAHRPLARSQTGARRRPARRQVVSAKPFRGRYVRAVNLTGLPVDLAWDATLRAAAPLQTARRSALDPAVVLFPRDLLRRLRLRHPGRLLLLVCDISGSMGTELMALAKRTALALLQRAYLARDQVAMLAFRGRTAELIFPPTNQAELVRQAMADLPCGGTTPLAAALELAHLTARRALDRDPALQVTMLLVSDGRANVGFREGHELMLDEIELLASALVRQPRLTVLFVDTTEKGKNDFWARWLSSRLGAQRFVLHRLLESGLDAAFEIAWALS